MMDTATIEKLADLLIDLDRAGVRELIPDGDTLRYRPRDALTPALAERLRTHKAELTAALRPPVAPAEPAEAVLLEECIDLPDPCPECGTLELWQTLAGNWRCLRCDPPTTARRLAKLAERLRRRKSRKNTTGRNDRY